MANTRIMSEESKEAFPLTWPTGWPRTKFPQRSRFAAWTLYKSRRLLENELRLLGTSSLVLSTNIPLRQDGLPYSNSREPSDHGVAVYFRLKGEPRVLACDKWDKVDHNMVALAKHVEAMRGQIRWGVGSVEQAFAGYKALPAMPGKRWWVVLGVDRMAPAEVVKRARVGMLKMCHPDRGSGDAALAAEVNAAYDEMLQERGIL